MKRLGFILFIIVTYPLTLLPMRAWYVLSDLLYVVFYHLLKYRRDVVAANLKNSFPEKSDAELKHIAKAFYKNLCDVFVETFKMGSIPADELLRRNQFDNLAILEKFKSENKSVAAVLGHFSNWEWTGYSISVKPPMLMFVIYRPLKNSYFEKYLIGIRNRFGNYMVKMDDIYRTLLRQSEPSISLFFADQSPPNTKGTYWTNFLSQDTPVFLGVEKIAAKLNSAVVFLYSLRVKRGHYKVYCHLLVEDPSQLKGEHEITELHLEFLEHLIREHPEQWLWSHKRWKHKRITE